MDNSKKASIRDLIDQALSENPKFFDMDKDIGIELRLNNFFKEKGRQPSQTEMSEFIDRLIDDIFVSFEESTERKDVRTRINEFNLQIYTIKSNPYFNRFAESELFGKVLSYYQIEDGTYTKDFVPSIDEKRTMSEDELRQGDYEIRMKHFRHIMDLYGTKMPMNYSDDMMIIDEVLEKQEGNAVQLDFGRMDTREAAYVTRILYLMGYRANFEEVKNGKVCAKKIPLIMQKRKDEKNGQQLGRESIGTYKDPAFTDEVYNRLVEYENSLDDLEMTFTGRTDDGDYEL